MPCRGCGALSAGRPRGRGGVVAVSDDDDGAAAVPAVPAAAPAAAAAAAALTAAAAAAPEPAAGPLPGLRTTGSASRSLESDVWHAASRFPSCDARAAARTRCC